MMLRTYGRMTNNNLTLNKKCTVFSLENNIIERTDIMKTGRIINLVLGLVMAFAVAAGAVCCFPAGAKAESGSLIGKTVLDGESGITYKITGAKKVQVISITDKKKVVIPDTFTYNNTSYKVANIKSNAARGSKKLQTLVIGGNVKVIGARAFYGCRKLSRITINATSIKRVGKKAFFNASENLALNIINGNNEKAKMITKAATNEDLNILDKLK